MNVDEILSGDTTIDASSLMPDLTSSITDMLAPFIWLSVALTVVFIVFYAMSMLRRRKVENAILDLQKILHEMNERDKSRGSTPAVPPRLERPPEKDRDRVIARSEAPEQ